MKRLARALCLMLSLCLFLLGCSLPGRKTPMAEAADFRMDTWVTQCWYGDGAEMACDEISDALQEMEKRFSLYLPDSEIAQVNAAAGKEFVSVSEETYRLLFESAQICAESGGLFDITIAPLAQLWDVTGQNPRVPTDREIAAALEKVNYQNLLFDEENRSVMLAEEGMRLDLGGAAKGLAAERMRAVAEKNGVSGYLSIGGNMLVVGKEPDGNDFLIGLRDPRGEASDYFATVAMDGYTMATTGDYERFFEEDGVRYHHVFDPFTGYPSDGGLIAVTVLAEDGLLADCLSTAIFLQGKDNLDAALSRTDCMVLAVTDTFDVYASPGFWERLTPEKGTRYTFHVSKN